MNVSADTRRTKSGTYSVTGALVRSDILELGVRGFADWLLASFGSAEPVQQPGRFQYIDDMWFSDAIELISNEFQQDVLDIAQPAIERALDEFSRERLQTGTYVGLHVLISLAESFRRKEAMPYLARILNCWMPSRGTPTKWPATLEEIVALREILESAYRQLLSYLTASCIRSRRTPISPKKLSLVAPVVLWCHEFIRSRQRPRDLTPTLAPAYYLALTQHVVFDELEDGFDVFDSALRAGAYRTGDINHSFYEFTSSKFPDNEFPYDIDAILDSRMDFVALLTGFAGRADAASLLLDEGDPFSEAPLSATNGNRPTTQSGDALLKVINEELAS